MTQQQTFSQGLEAWLGTKQTKTFLSLNQVFAEKAFAVAFILLLSISALPLPTAGATHIFEIIAMLLSLELIAGQTKIWLPKRWRNKQLGRIAVEKVIPALLKLVRFIERLSRPRLEGIVRGNGRLFGILVFIFSLSAFVAPPFSGLDTLPSLGVVFASLGMITSDIVIVALGLAIGSLGIGVELALGTALYKALLLL